MPLERKKNFQQDIFKENQIFTIEIIDYILD
jgi:hypothetical protein